MAKQNILPCPIVFWALINLYSYQLLTFKQFFCESVIRNFLFLQFVFLFFCPEEICINVVCEMLLKLTKGVYCLQSCKNVFLVFDCYDCELQTKNSLSVFLTFIYGPCVNVSTFWGDAVFCRKRQYLDFWSNSFENIIPIKKAFNAFKLSNISFIIFFQ